MFPFQVLTRVLYIYFREIIKLFIFFLISDIHYRDKPLHLFHFQFFRLIYSEKRTDCDKKKKKEQLPQKNQS